MVGKPRSASAAWGRVPFPGQVGEALGPLRQRGHTGGTVQETGTLLKVPQSFGDPNAVHTPEGGEWAGMAWTDCAHCGTLWTSPGGQSVSQSSQHSWGSAPAPICPLVFTGTEVDFNAT